WLNPRRAGSPSPRGWTPSGLPRRLVSSRGRNSKTWPHAPVRSTPGSVVTRGSPSRRPRSSSSSWSSFFSCRSERMRLVGAYLAAGLCVTVAATGCHRPADAGGTSIEEGAAQTVRVLDVPFVPQSPALCGGAALAMVIRYWDGPAVLAGDFADRIAPEGKGIRTED